MAITAIAMNKCSPTIGNGFSLFLLAILILIIVIRNTPQRELTIATAHKLVNINVGIKKVKAKKNLDKKVYFVDFQTCPFVFPKDSSEICIPKESDIASAIAIVKIPPKTASLEYVLKIKPIIKPRVVITPEVVPKFIPLFFDLSIIMVSICLYLLGKVLLPLCFLNQE